MDSPFHYWISISEIFTIFCKTTLILFYYVYFEGFFEQELGTIKAHASCTYISTQSAIISIKSVSSTLPSIKVYSILLCMIKFLVNKVCEYNPSSDKLYPIQFFEIKFVGDLWQMVGFHLYLGSSTH